MRYLITEFTGLGNFIQKTPMIREIHDMDEAAEIFIIGDNQFGGLEAVRFSKFIKEVLIVEKTTSKQKILNWINEKHFNVVLDPAGSFTPFKTQRIINRSNVNKIVRVFNWQVWVNGLWLSKLKMMIKILLDGKKVSYVPTVQGRHEIDANYDALEVYLNKPIDRNYQTWVAHKNNLEVLNRLKLKPHTYLCLQPSARNGEPTPKTWHPKNFFKLINSLHNDFKEIKFILLGDEGDYIKVISKFKWPEYVINTAGSTNINEVMNLIINSLGVVAHDSGIMHIANALKVPLIALYGPTDYTWTIPKGSNTTVLFSRTEAFIAMYNRRNSEEELAKAFPNHSAMDGITVKEVCNVIKTWLLD